MENNQRSSYPRRKTLTPLASVGGQQPGVHAMKVENNSGAEQVVSLPDYDKAQPILHVCSAQPAAALRHQLNAALHHSRTTGHEPALVVLRIDEFTLLSETFGKQLSADVESRLESCLRPTDMVRKLDDEEFAIVLGNPKNVDDICNMVQLLVDTCCGRYELGVRDPIIKTSAGITLFPRDADQSEELVRFARIALQRADASQKPYQFFSPELLRWQKNKVWTEALVPVTARNGDLGLPDDFIPIAQDNSFFAKVSEG